VVGGGIRAQGLGGGAFGLRDSLSFNSQNPALLALIPRTTVRFGGETSFWSTSSAGQKATDSQFLWKDVRLYLPLSRVWKIGLGAQPTRFPICA
jgi:hypothetical protein